MGNSYLVVDRTLLPPLCEKVAEAKRLISDGDAKDVSEAVKIVGISRSTYYKYRDFVKEMSTVSMRKHAIISMMMTHEVGLLSSMLRIVSEYDFSIWTINQNPPVDGKANVVITLDIGDSVDSIDDLITDIKGLKGLSKVQLLGID